VYIDNKDSYNFPKKNKDLTETSMILTKYYAKTHHHFKGTIFIFHYIEISQWQPVKNFMLPVWHGAGRATPGAGL
jgi:hypothetical protein